MSYRNTAKLVWAMNSLPGLYDANNGLFRRVKILELGRSIPAGRRDPSKIESVRNEGPGIVNWALDGLARLNEREQFEYPTAILAATKRFSQDNDLPGQFLAECCERAPSEQLFYTGEYRVYAGDLTKAFNAWTVDKGHKPWSEHSLAPEWKRLKLEKGKRQGKGIPYYGVELV